LVPLNGSSTTSSRARGTPLYDMIAARGPLPHGRLAAIASQRFAGLAAIHAAALQAAVNEPRHR
jgi:hypothetical protein